MRKGVQNRIVTTEILAATAPIQGGYRPIHGPLCTRPRSLLLLRGHPPQTQAQRAVGTSTTPCAAGKPCSVPDRTPERPDGHERRGKCGGRLHTEQRLCHDCLATVIVREVNVEEKEDDSDDGTTAVRLVGAPPPALSGAVVVRRFTIKRGGVRQQRCFLLSAEAQDGVHQSACL